MRIIGIETVQLEEMGNLVWVRLHTDEGLVGLGETFRNPQATIAYVHETCAPALIGEDPRRPTALRRKISKEVGNHFNGFPTRSIEVRGNSAVDTALWDLTGQAANVPLHTLLGGKTRDRIRIYNTCANAAYNNKIRHGYNTQLISRQDPRPDSIEAYEDLFLQVYEPAQLAEELVDQGITAMKIWPFDTHAVRNNGEQISNTELKEGLWPIEQIRDAVGDKMDIMVEYHGLWRLTPALEIASALNDFSIFWHEDPIRLDNFDDLARFKAQVSGRVCASENMGTLPWYREVFTRGAVDVASFDMAWVGGISEGLRIAHLAEAFDRTIAPHDCTGPVTLVANTHLLASAANGLIAETVRSHLAGFYGEIVTAMPHVDAGYIYPLDAPGLGTALNPEIFKRGDASIRISGQRCS